MPQSDPSRDRTTNSQPNGNPSNEDSVKGGTLPKEPLKTSTDSQSPKRDNPKAPLVAKPSSRRRTWVVLLMLVVIGAGLFASLYWLQKEVDETNLELMGNIDVRQVNLAFKVEGRIETLAVDEGDAVKAHDVLATLDKRYFNDELRILRARRDNQAANVAKLEHGSRPEEIAQARAQTEDREAAVTKAKEDYHRAESLVSKGGVSRQEFDRYQSALDSAEAQLKAAKESQRLVEIGPRQEDIDMAKAFLAEQDAMIIQSERRLADADLIAPNDGTILTRARERGAILQPGETVLALTLTSPVWVRTYVNERDLGLIKPEMPAQVITDSAPDHPYTGKIGFISPTAEFTPKSVETRERRTDLVYRLRVVVENPDGGLRQGMPVTVRVELPAPRQRTFFERVRDTLRERFGSKQTGKK
ncbi:secretion protein HlyD [Schlesneria paludicola]|uniref:secretion protein HlyD n=1 Tax=Schlesneria paludicola TaxID=360056 RepID=UPI00029AAED6|nr:secretion protein HlyD [Schlesneria paludicola]